MRLFYLYTEYRVENNKNQTTLKPMSYTFVTYTIMCKSRYMDNPRIKGLGH